jgi:hypothetical protein
VGVMCKGLPLMYHIKNKENYLGLVWLISFFSAGIFFVPTFFCFAAIAFPSIGFPIEFLLEHVFIFIYGGISFIGSAIFLKKNKSFSVQNFDIAFRYSLIPISSVAILCVLVLYIIFSRNYT